MLTVSSVESRVRRLEELCLGLAKERAVIGEANDPLLYLERRAYLLAIGDALAGADRARVVLAKALQRLGAAGDRAA